MATLDDFNSAVTGAMMGDQLAEQQLLMHLTTMNQSLTAAAPIFETARQIPIATTLGQMNLAQSRYYNEGLLPVRQVEAEQARLRTLGVTPEVNADIEQSRYRQNVMRFQANVAQQIADTPAEQVTEFQLQTLERLNKLLGAQKIETETRALIPKAGETAVDEQTQARKEAQAAAAAADVKYQEARTLADKPFGLQSLAETQTIADARARIAGAPLRTKIEEQRVTQGAQAIERENIQLEFPRRALEDYKREAITDPVQAERNYLSRMQAYASANQGFPLTATLEGQLKNLMINGATQAIKDKARADLDQLNDGLRMFDKLQREGKIGMGFDSTNMYQLALGLSSTPEGLGMSRVISDMIQNQNYQQSKADEVSARQSGYGAAAYFKKSISSVTGETAWLDAYDYDKLKPAARIFLNNVMQYDKPGQMETVQWTAKAIENQTHLQRAIGYGIIPRAVATAKEHESDAWITGDKKQGSLVYGINSSVPYYYTRLFPQAIPTAKAIAANFVTHKVFDNAEKSLKLDIEYVVNTLTANKQLSMTRAIEILMSAPSTPEQIDAFNKEYPGLGTRLQDLTNTYLNLTAYPVGTTDTTPEADKFSTELGGYAPVPPTTSPEELKRLRRQPRQRYISPALPGGVQ